MENIYLPETIRVGYDKRSDTYTGKLAYVIYIDEKGKVRKEASWNSWRDEKIEPNDFKNEPIEGFVLNKKVGGYSSGWDHRQTYTRIYDPRGFEFEITIENLLYILENTSCIKGKGLEGKFVYGWSGKDLLLIPCDSPDYAKLETFSKQIQNYKQTKVKAKELIFGAVYRNKQNEDLVYMDRMDKYDTYGWQYGEEDVDKNCYFFYNLKSKEFMTYKSPSVLIGLTDANPVSNYAELMDNLLHSEMISPIDPSKDEFIDFTEEEAFKELAQMSHWGHIFGVYNGEIAYFDISLNRTNKEDEDELDYDYENDIDWEEYERLERERNLKSTDVNHIFTVTEIELKGSKYYDVYHDYDKTVYNRWDNTETIKGTAKELHDKFKFKLRKQYLKNGNEKR